MTQAVGDAAAAAQHLPVATSDEVGSIDLDAVWSALGMVIDPEIGEDIVTLGMVYDVEAIENAVRVTFSLTIPGCPMQDLISQGIAAAGQRVPGVESVIPNLVWEPRWHPGMIKEGA